MSTRKAGVATVMTARVNPALAVFTKSCNEACQERITRDLNTLSTHHIESASQDFIDAVDITIQSGQHGGFHDHAT